jgi:hypothetical protein
MMPGQKHSAMDTAPDLLVGASARFLAGRGSKRDDEVINNHRLQELVEADRNHFGFDSLFSVGQEPTGSPLSQ